MRKLILALSLIFSLAGWATTFTATAKSISGAVLDEYIQIELKGCSTYIARDGTAVYFAPVKLKPNGVGLITAQIIDSSTLTCGTSTGTAYYKISLYQRDKGTDPYSLRGSNDYDVIGTTFELSTATPRAATAISASVLKLGITWDWTNPTQADRWLKQVATNMTFLRLTCYAPSGSATIQIERRATAGGTGTNLLSSPLTCDSTEPTTTTFLTGSADQGQWLVPVPQTINGASALSINLHYQLK